MYHVLKARMGGPEEYTEYCYGEAVTVRGGFTWTTNPATAQELTVACMFDEVATLATEEEVRQYLAEQEHPKEPTPSLIPTIQPPGLTHIDHQKLVPWYGPGLIIPRLS